MKIAYCTPSLYIPGGVERVLTTKANYLADVAGYDIYIILTDGKGKEPYYELSKKIHVINLDINFEELWNKSFLQKIPVYLKKQARYKKLLKKTLYEIKPDMTVSLLRREINFITSIHDGSKKIGELHFNRSSYRIFNAPFFPKRINKIITNVWQNQLIKQIRLLDRFIVLSNEDAKAWGNIRNMEVIPNPIKSYPDKTSSCDNKKVIAAGRYTWQKGFDMLIKAWEQVDKKHPDWELHIYGPGDKTNYQEIAGHGVFCHDAVKDIYAKYQESSIFAFSSRYEGFGLVLAEAMSCGIPAVSFACPCGPKDIITNDGILVTPENTEEFASGICKLIENETLRKEMGQYGHINMERFEENAIMQKWIKIFGNISNNKN